MLASLTAWLESIARPSAWLSLDDNDNELPVFVHLLTTALQSVFPDAFQATAGLLQASQFPSPVQVATLFINDLADVPEDVILVLDDYHTIHSSEIHALLDFLIEHLPSQLHLVLSTRFDPLLPLARWRARGHLSELRGADLRFTLQETQAFLARVVGKDLAQQIVEALEERTEGWIAMVRLAALSLRHTSDAASFMQRLGPSPDRNMSRYLVEEVLDQLAPAVQEVLVRTSILEQYCAELCTAILGNDAPNTQVQATLDWLERSNLFLVPLDDRQGWYRFHHLFQQLLQQRLQARISTEEMATLHRRASAWYAGQRLIEQALKHSLAAGDGLGAAQLVEAHFLWTFEQEQWMQLERALALARPAGFIRIFADLPKLSTLLHELRKRRKASHAPDSKVDAYLQRILVAMSPSASQAVSKEALMKQEGLEPLTDRELQILRLLDKDLTNKEIARELVVTPGTVKVHTTNVYRKLSVNNRRAAVTLSKALGLLAAT